MPQSGIGGSATITIEYKKFGVGLEITPTVLNDAKIALKVHPIVSELDFGNAITTSSFVIPALKTREMETHVEIKDGETLAISGLLQAEHRDNINKYPILGDIPSWGSCSAPASTRRTKPNW